METMFSLREMNPLKASKKASTAANKIRNKILNTSSFFKVSLQTNNRALAQALEAQKERCRQLEKKVWLMQKEVEMISFQLASRNYKHRRLMMILKNLQRDTMEQLSSATDLLTSSEDNRASSGQHEASPAPGSIPESLGSIRTSVKTVRDQLVCDAADQRCSEEVGPSRPSISLREEVERFSAALSQSILVPQSHEEACPPAASTDEALPPQSSRPEKTVLLNSSMEMTVCSDVDIVTVDTTARRRQQKKPQNESRTCSGSGIGLSHTDQEGYPERSAPKARFMRAALSRIPKLRPPEQRVLPTADMDLDLDDYFKDPQKTSITCRKSRSRPRKTLVSSPDPVLLGSVDCPQPTSAVTCSRGSGKSRCRSTFVVALISSSGRVPQEDSPSEELPNARADAQSNGKRSWEASEEQLVTPDPQLEVLTQDPAPGPQTQKQKRARREEPGRTTKKKKGSTKDSNVEPSSHPNTNDTCGAPPEGKQATPPESDIDHKPKPLCGMTFSPPSRSRNLRETFEFYRGLTPNQSEEGGVITATPHRERGGVSMATPHRGGASTATPHREGGGVSMATPHRGGVRTTTPHREGGGISEATPHRGGVSTATPHREGGGVSEAAPHRGGVNTATPHREGGGVSVATPHRETGSWRTTRHVVNTSPGRVLTSLTNTLTPPEGEVGGRGRRRHAVVSYREPTLNSKMRRGDKFTETTFLSSPQFRDVKKKKRQKKGAGLTAASNTEDIFMN